MRTTPSPPLLQRYLENRPIASAATANKASRKAVKKKWNRRCDRAASAGAGSQPHKESLGLSPIRLALCWWLSSELGRHSAHRTCKLHNRAVLISRNYGHDLDLEKPSLAEDTALRSGKVIRLLSSCSDIAYLDSNMSVGNGVNSPGPRRNAPTRKSISRVQRTSAEPSFVLRFGS